MDWQTGDALHPETFARHLDGAAGVVHTLGILLEDAEYKRAVREGDAPALLRALLGSGRNPLAPPPATATYEAMNRDAGVYFFLSKRVLTESAHSPPRMRGLSSVRAAGRGCF